MEIASDINLSFGNYTFARITKCRIYGINNTFSEMEMTFEFTIAPIKENIGSRNAQLNRLVIDLYLNDGKSNPYIGLCHDKFIQPSTFNYEHGHQQQLRLSTNAFLKLVDETHFKDLNLKVRVQSLLELEEIPKNSSGGNLSNSKVILLEGEGYLKFPHSDWVKMLNHTGIDRFDVITLRTNLANMSDDNTFTQAFDKLKEAQDKFNRGDWNSVGATCRSAFRTLLNLAKGEKNPIQKLLTTVLEEPKRTQIATTLIPVLNILNVSTHQEGKPDLPPADFQREDALLCLHITGAAISYIATVYK